MVSIPVTQPDDTTTTFTLPHPAIEDTAPPPTSTSTTPTTSIVRRPQRPASGRPRTNWTQEELRYFLHLMEEILPIGPDEWELTVSRHAIPYSGRDVEGLRRKYNTLHRKKCPTGDPNIPWEVDLAKRIKFNIGEKACLGGGDEEYDLETNTFSGPGALGTPPQDDYTTAPPLVETPPAPAESRPRDGGSKR